MASSFDQVDVNKFVVNLVTNYYEDLLIGTLNGQAQKRMPPVVLRPKNSGFDGISPLWGISGPKIPDVKFEDGWDLADEVTRALLGSLEERS